MEHQNAATVIALLLTIIGAINWGSVALFNIDVISFLFETNTPIIKALHILIAMAGAYLLVSFFKIVKKP